MFYQKTISALEKFIQNVHWGEKLTMDESAKNLEESLVEIVYSNSGSHKGNALLITENGYLLTSNHFWENKLDVAESSIVTYDGKIYPVVGVCQTNEKEDLSLFKAGIHEKPAQKIYKFCNTDKLREYYKPLEFPVCIKTRWNRRVRNNFGSLVLGRIDLPTIQFENQFRVDARIRYGDSGGIVLSPDAGLMGFNSNGVTDENARIKRCHASKIFSALNLVQEEINFLKNNWLSAIKREQEFNFIKVARYLI